MSDDEKKAQIADSVSEYQEAKVNTAHVERKLLSIFRAYRILGERVNEEKGTVSLPLVRDGKVDIGNSWKEQKFSQSDLLNAADLVQVLNEHRQCCSRLERARRGMADLGINSIR